MIGLEGVLGSPLLPRPFAGLLAGGGAEVRWVGCGVVVDPPEQLAANPLPRLLVGDAVPGLRPGDLGRENLHALAKEVGLVGGL